MTHSILTQASDKLKSEIRRGAIVLAVMGQLTEEHYGYLLRKRLADRGLNVEEGTLYPLIRRLEAQGLLQSEWRYEDKRKKRFYRLSPAGQEVYEQLQNEWIDLDNCLRKIIAGDNP